MQLSYINHLNIVPTPAIDCRGNWIPLNVILFDIKIWYNGQPGWIKIQDPGFTSTGLLMKSFRGSFRADNAHGAATRRSMWTMLSWRFTRSGSLVPGVGWRMIRFHSEFSRCFAMFPTSKWPESVDNTSSSLAISNIHQLWPHIGIIWWWTLHFYTQ